ACGGRVICFGRKLKGLLGKKPFGDWIGVQPDDLLGHAVRDVLAGEAFAELQGYIARAFPGGPFSYERRDHAARTLARFGRPCSRPATRAAASPARSSGCPTSRKTFVSAMR